MAVTIEHEKTKERKVLDDDQYRGFMVLQGNERVYWRVVETTTTDPNSPINQYEREQQWLREKHRLEAKIERLEAKIERLEREQFHMVMDILDYTTSGRISLWGKIDIPKLTDTAKTIRQHTHSSFTDSIVAAAAVLDIERRFVIDADEDEDEDEDEDDPVEE